jgi:hypothetical protein
MQNVGEPGVPFLPRHLFFFFFFLLSTVVKAKKNPTVKDIPPRQVSFMSTKNKKGKKKKVGICRYTAGQKKKVGPLSLSSSTAAR